MEGFLKQKENRMVTKIEDFSFINRHTNIRESKINPCEHGADFSVDTHLGIRILTDSEKLANEIQSTITTKNIANPIDVDFIYLTKNKVAVLDKNEIPPKPISVGVLGDLVVDKSLKQYILSGPDKFGSVESVLFGIYSFERAKEGFLGLHAAQVYDKQKNVSHIITGNSSVGKSTFAQILEKSYPDRFHVLADDWIEIDPSQKKVMPISNTFSSRDGTLTDELVSSNTKVNNKFTSFNKNFFTYDKIVRSTENLGSVILLSDPSYTQSKEGIMNCFIDSNRHIPFMTQINTEKELLPLSVTNRLGNILFNFSKLRRSKNFSVTNFTNTDIYENA